MEKRELNERIGRRLRAIRLAQGLSLEACAVRCGVSKPMLVQIERALSNPTVSTLWKIAEGLKVPFTAFIEETEDEASLVKRTELSPIHEDSGRFEVYPVFPMNGARPFEIYEVRLKPGCDYRAKAHPGRVEEFLWVTEGNMVVELGGRAHELVAGEGLRFAADRPHRYINNGGREAALVMVIYYY